MWKGRRIQESHLGKPRECISGTEDLIYVNETKNLNLRKKCVIILDEGMLFFYKFAHDFKSFC